MLWVLNRIISMRWFLRSTKFLLTLIDEKIFRILRSQLFVYPKLSFMEIIFQSRMRIANWYFRVAISVLKVVATNFLTSPTYGHLVPIIIGFSDLSLQIIDMIFVPEIIV